MRQIPINIRRVWVKELQSRLWFKTWRGPGNEVPEWFPHGLSSARPCLGYGVIEPLELRIDGSLMTLVCFGRGKTLMKRFRITKYSPLYERHARGAIHEICYGLHRIHQTRGPHGGVTPVNIYVSDQELLSFWSLPTARLELTVGTPESEWELPYRSPQLLDGESPTFEDDVYAVGIIFARLLFGTAENFANWLCNPTTADATTQALEILARSTSDERALRFSSALELAQAIDPSTELRQLDIKKSGNSKRLGTEAFRQNECDKALEHFQEAVRHDWLSAANHNNIAVCLMQNENWADAHNALEKAYQICNLHPLFDTNRGLCLYQLGEKNKGFDLIRRGLALNPNFHQPMRILGSIAKEENAIQAALRFTHNALIKNPESRATRLQLAELDESEADTLKRSADKLPHVPPLFEHLITEDTPPPWSLNLKGESRTILRRLEAVGSRIDCEEAFDAKLWKAALHNALGD